MLGPIAWRTPPRHYGPWEQVTSLLTEGLVARGVDVTLFATADSVTAAALDGVCPHGYAEDPEHGRPGLGGAPRRARAGALRRVRPRAQPPRLAAARFASHCGAPMVTTIHGFSGSGILPAYASARSAFVSISDADRAPELDYAATVHHGIDIEPAALLPRRQGETWWSSAASTPTRARPRRSRSRGGPGGAWSSAGIVQDQRYFDEQVEPHIDGERVVYLGSVGPRSGAPRCSARRQRCCIRSRSTSRSGCRWSRRWPAARRSSPTAAARCPRSSTTG